MENAPFRFAARFLRPAFSDGVCGRKKQNCKTFLFAQRLWKSAPLKTENPAENQYPPDVSSLMFVTMSLTWRASFVSLFISRDISLMLYITVEWCLWNSSPMFS